MTDSITQKMSAMKVAAVSSDEIVDKLSREALRGLYRVDNRNVAVEKVKRIELVNHVKSSVNYSSAKLLINALSTEQLGELLAPVGIQHAHNNEKSRVVLTKRLMEQLTKTNVAEYLSQYAEIELIKSFFEALDMSVPKTAKKESLIDQLCEELDREGMHIYLESLPLAVLRDVAFELKLEKDADSTASQKALIQAITTLSEVRAVAPKRKAEKIVISSKKPKIKAGVTYHDMFQHYNVAELIKYAKDNNIKTTGTKKELINRIIAWLEGDKENTVAGTRKAPKRRGGKKAAAAKKTTKPAVVEEADEEIEDASDEEEEVAPVEKKQPAKGKQNKKQPTPVVSEDEDEDEASEEEPAPAPKKQDNKKAVVQKKPEPVEEEVDSDEGEEAGEDEDIDLDDLNRYSLRFLRSYCEEEGLKPAGSKKEDFIAAIIAYNEDDGEEEDSEDEEEQ